jgi:receptor protein-tyrosine kinase
LVDADTTHQKLSQLLAIKTEPGLLDLLAGKDLSVSDALLPTSVERLTVLPSGARRPHATELLASDSMERLVARLASEYSDRIVIFDAPPLLGAPEPAVLATHMGQMIVVVAAGHTTHKVLADALSTIESCPRIALVLNKTARPSVAYSYYG